MRTVLSAGLTALLDLPRPNQDKGGKGDKRKPVDVDDVDLEDAPPTVRALSKQAIFQVEWASAQQGRGRVHRASHFFGCDAGNASSSRDTCVRPSNDRWILHTFPYPGQEAEGQALQGQGRWGEAQEEEGDRRVG